MKTAMFYIMTLLALFTFSACNDDKNPDPGTGGSEASITVVVKGQGGALLNQASVSIDNTSGLTDQEGLVTLDVSLAEEAVVRVTQAGYVNQSVTTAITEVTDLQVIMIPVKEVFNIADIEQAQVIKGSDLNAQITLPANALVDADGNIAEGNVTLNLTPWDITDSDIAAMLGNGQALTAQNERVELISAGMMSVSFYDSQGNYLQLAENTTAQIQMDLPYDSINNQALAIGSTIPLWHFDEVQGLWIEEGTGVVVASITSPVGLAVQADVPHFSTWNWDYKRENAGSVTVNCLDSNGNATTCYVVADVTLDDGSRFTASQSVPLEGLTVINMPSSGSIVWTASKSGLIGRQTSGVNGSVLITLQASTTKNFVQCTENNSPIACTTSLESLNNPTLEFSIPALGATIETIYENVTEFTWNARSQNRIEGSNIVYYTGSSTSNTTEDVNIDLSTRVEIGIKASTLIVGCVNAPGITSVVCDIHIDNDQEAGFSADFSDVPIGNQISVTLPDNLSSDDRIRVRGEGKNAGGAYLSFGQEEFQYDSLTDGQTIVIELEDNAV